MQTNLKALIDVLISSGRRVLLIGHTEAQYRIFIITQFTPAGRAFGTVDHSVEGYELENLGNYMGVDATRTLTMINQKLDGMRKVKISFSSDYSYEYYDSL